MTDYIPKLATIEQSCEWLRARLGGVWILPRLLECHLKPYFWIDYKPGHPQIFGGKVEGTAQCDPIRQELFPCVNR